MRGSCGSPPERLKESGWIVRKVEGGIGVKQRLEIEGCGISR
jgi:hypothetical protein